MELDPRERGVLEQIELLIRQGRPEAEAAETLAVITGERELVERMVRYRHEIAEQRRNIAGNVALYDPEDASDPWYTGPAANDIFWPGLASRLTSDPAWAAAVGSLDESSTDLVGLLADPHSEKIQTRGLVLGYVQSGKTANFTATVAKAADAGYRLFIVLSGVHNALRRQTQLRLEQQLTNDQPARWLLLTTEQSDFGNPVKALPLLAQPNLRLLAVVKKNVSRLTRLRNWLYEAHRHGGLDTCPVLIIDDESDQASPNSAKNAELDQTRINERIRELLQLPRVAYTGYTATPFANVLINPADLADIYPRSFIYSLEKPPTYFGARELFGPDVSEEEANPDDAPHDMIRFVADDEADRHSTRRLTEGGVEVTPALGDSIRWFLLATAARQVRSGRRAHSSMLVHTTMRVLPQLDYLPEISAYLQELQRELDTDQTAFRAMWDDETRREPAARHGLARLSFDDVAAKLGAVTREARVVADNSASIDRLIYGDDPATVIAVGGNTLSRGLTLEGLVSSYFLRSATTYDSLLQMGRWFGYRPGYSDLPRIWTTHQLADDFEFLSEVEEALRREIKRYRTIDGATPANLPVRIRRHPRLHATSRIRMQFAVVGDASYSGQRPQTTYFAHTDSQVCRDNTLAARQLLAAITAMTDNLSWEDTRLVVRDVPAALVLEFIGRYRFHPSSEMTADLLSNYIHGQLDAGALSAWNVVLVGRRRTSSDAVVDLGVGRDWPLITRSKLARSEPLVANIGTLMSRPDRVADLVPSADVMRLTDLDLQRMRNNVGRALLLLYPINKDSEPKSALVHRAPLAAVEHLVGVAFSFPQADPNTEPESTIQVDPALLPSSDELDDYVDSEDSRDDVDLGDG